MKFYLGGPINGCTDEEASGWREVELLKEQGVALPLWRAAV